MDFTFKDMGIMFSMAIAVVLMTFTFSALGLADSSVSTNEIPKYNSSGSNFQIVGEFPDNPGTPSSFTLEYNQKIGIGASDNHIWLDGDTSGGTEIFLEHSGNMNDSDITIQLNDWDNGKATKYTTTLQNESNVTTIKQANYSLYVEYDELKDYNTSEMKIDVLIKIRDRDTNSDTEEMPIIGGIISAGGNLYGSVSWIGSIIYWFSAMIFEVAIGLILTLVNVIMFFVGTMHWLLSSYTAIISGANNWASVFVALPGLLLGAEFAKMMLIGIKLLPTT